MIKFELVWEWNSVTIFKFIDTMKNSKFRASSHQCPSSTKSVSLSFSQNNVATYKKILISNIHQKSYAIYWITSTCTYILLERIKYFNVLPTRNIECFLTLIQKGPHSDLSKGKIKACFQPHFLRNSDKSLLFPEQNKLKQIWGTVL